MAAHIGVMVEVKSPQAGSAGNAFGRTVFFVEEREKLLAKSVVQDFQAVQALTQFPDYPLQFGRGLGGLLEGEEINGGRGIFLV